MALGIKKITESVIEDGRSLTITGTLNNNNIAFTDNNALPAGALLASPDGTLRIKASLNQQVKINAKTTLVPQSVDTSILEDKAVTTAKLNDKAVTSVKINDSAVQTNHINNGAVITSKIFDAAVTSPKIADAAVKENHIANNSIRTDHIKDGNVTSNKIKDNNVINSHIRDSAVTSSKIAPKNIEYKHMTSNAINTENLINYAVITDKIANKNVTLIKLADDVLSHIQNMIKSYVDPALTKLKVEIMNQIPKHIVEHDGSRNVNGANNSTALNNLKCTGDIEGNRVFFMTYQDLAEGYIPGEELERGDIVAMHEDGKVYRAESINDCIVGVISEDFANCFGATKAELFEGSKVAVGMIGKVVVKVKGPIKIGQQVAVSLSDAGVGCASNTRGIGQALHSIDCDFDEINEVLVQIRPM